MAELDTITVEFAGISDDDVEQEIIGRVMEILKSRTVTSTKVTEGTASLDIII